MTKLFEKYKDKVLTLLVFAATFVTMIFPYRDKDWGWHYRYGEYLLTHGKLLMHDIYSWTMEGYPWVNHEWLFDPTIYTVFKNLGYIGAALMGTVLIFFCFWLLVKKFKLPYWKLSIAAFFFFQLVETGIREGLRAQVLALIPLAILIYILMRSRDNLKLLWFLPLLMLAWVNLHGTFAYGLLIIAVFFACYFFTFPKKHWLLIGVGLASILATLFNPYVLGVYHEVLKHSSSPYLKNVFEWMPITDNCEYCHVPTFSIYLILLALAFIEAPTAQNLPFLLISLILVIPTFLYRRNLPTFGLATFPLLAFYIESWKFDLSKYKITPFIFLIGSLVVIEYNLFSRLPSFNFYKYGEQNYCQFASNCSINLVNTLKLDPPKGIGLNFYDWGGYLIGKQVPFKLFIDGRMHLWQDSNGYMPFADYIDIYYNGDIDKFNQFNFDWVIIPPASDVAKEILDQKVQGNWLVKYQDQYSIYFVNAKLK